MKFIKNNAGAIAVVALVIAIVAIFTPVGRSVVSKFGGVTNYDEVDATAIKIGTSGSRIGNIIQGTCTLILSAGTNQSSVVASTTQPYDCAVTGVVSGDNVSVQESTSTPLAFGAWVITGASASSTSGFITLQVMNLTGATKNFPREIGSSTTYFISHPVSTVPGL